MKIVVWKRGQKVNIRHGDGLYLSAGYFILNSIFMVFDLVTSAATPTALCKFQLHAYVLQVGNKNFIVALSCVMENGILVDTS